FEPFAQQPRLILEAKLRHSLRHLLEEDDVRLLLQDGIDDPIEVVPPVDAADALVNVPAHDADAHRLETMTRRSERAALPLCRAGALAPTPLPFPPALHRTLASRELSLGVTRCSAPGRKSGMERRTRLLLECREDPGTRP